MKPDPDFIRRERELYQQESFALRQTFERTGNGAAAIRRRSILVDGILRKLAKQFISENPEQPGLSIVATGGFGRRDLFPNSDIDVLYLCSNDDVEHEFRNAIRECNQGMWDIGLRASPAARIFKELDRF
ncbi:MAG TPA: nucleotidyltransferase domain-containing protein, partial [Acidisarcina sp.]